MENEEVKVTKTEETTGVSKTDKALAYGLLAGGIIGTGYLIKDKVIPFVKKSADKIKMQKANKAKNLSEPVAENETKKK